VGAYFLDSRASAEKFQISREGVMGKIAKNTEKIALSTLFQKKDRKIAKKHQKIALLSLYLIYLYPRASAKIFQGGQRKKDRKISKK